MGHLADTGHQPDNDASKIIYKVPQNKSKQARIRHLSTAESVAIKIMNPPLCKQKKMVAALQLPWPQSNLRDDPNHDLNRIMMTQHDVTNDT
ncbi:unnamed protein product [Echinostoma caproni]|uniref:Protein kinase domain-containing protein n=1 Tax=Echinostoma caproni TaxID=27848 RepID=A0A183A5K5_9TREM|nr:unnamed protein product [Echinostoma caproni]